MVKLVLLHKADSIYEDVPDAVYDFPRSYLRAVEEAVGDWVIYYEPVKAGARGYFAVAKIAEIVPKPGATPTEEDIRDFCRDRIAHFKVPALVRFKPDLPMTVTGKPQKFVMRDAMIAELGITPEATA